MTKISILLFSDDTIQYIKKNTLKNSQKNNIITK